MLSNTSLLKAIELAFLYTWSISCLAEGEENPKMALFSWYKIWCLNVSGYWPVACKESLCHWNFSTPFEEYSEHVTQTNWSLYFRESCLRMRILSCITSSGACARLCARVAVHGNSYLCWLLIKVDDSGRIGCWEKYLQTDLAKIGRDHLTILNLLENSICVNFYGVT